MASQAQWFNDTSSLRSGIQLINEIDDGKLLRLLSRIISNLNSKHEKAFSEEEELKLQAAFNLSAKQMESVLDTISFIMEQAVYHLAKPKVFTQQLLSIKLQDEKIEVFTKIWEEEGPSVIEDFRKRSLAPKQLDTINWELRLQTSQLNQTKMKVPSAIFELGLSGQNCERLQMEFSHKELYGFFQQLEKIQASLDSLNK